MRMRLKGNVRIDSNVKIGIGYGIMVMDNHLVGSEKIKVTNELLHAITVDYFFHICQSKIDNMPVSALTMRRKAMRRLCHDIDIMHNQVDKILYCPLIKGEKIDWNVEIYNFESQKFNFENNLMILT